jgi:hypothetical protein
LRSAFSDIAGAGIHQIQLRGQIRPAPVTAMTLESSQALEGGAMLLRYRIQNADIQAATGR